MRKQRETTVTYITFFIAVHSSGVNSILGFSGPSTYLINTLKCNLDCGERRDRVSACKGDFLEEDGSLRGLNNLRGS